MKICFVNPTEFQRPIYILAKKLADRGHTCTVLQPAGNWIKYPVWDNVTVINIPSFHLPEIRYAIPAIWAEYQILAKLVQEEGYQLIHAQDYFNLPTLPPIFIRKRLGIPITLVNNALVGVTWGYGKWFFDGLTKLYTYTLGRFILRSYDRLSFLYERLGQDTAKFLGPEIPPWETIPIGVDLSLFYPVSNSTKRRELNIKDSDKVILFVGRFNAVKRVEWVIKLTETLVTKDMSVRTVIVGGGKFGHGGTETHYQRLAESLGEAIVFVGPKDHQELREYYAIADVLVLPSRSEGIPNVLLEASVCEVPCVASDVGGIQDIIRHGETGYVFPPNGFEAFVGYVEAILSDHRKAQVMGQRAREWVMARFDWDKIVDRYEQIFHELIDARQRNLQPSFSKK